jgi:ligand-binding SRPBCC domain-containing protein
MGTRFHTLRREQWIQRPICEVFTFFADARNLEEITPPWLHFRILAVDSGAIREGTEIRYRLRLHGVPIYWRTEIRKWEPPHRFSDVQRSGPYRLWHHTHVFEAHGERTRMLDIVRYRLPFGFLGRIVHAVKVRADVTRIFDYRYRRIAELFADSGPAGH